jgi:protein phosphatase
MILELNDLSLVLLIGPSGSGKSTFAAKHFAPTEVLASDRFRAMIADDEGDQSVNAEAFELLHRTAEIRLALGRFTVIDATNVEKKAREPLVRIARAAHVERAAIVLDVPTRACEARNLSRARQVPREVLHEQRMHLHGTLSTLEKERFARVYVLDDAAIERAQIVRVPDATDRRDDRGPFDVIGDIHGCARELRTLLARLGYVEESGVYRHPAGRRAVFLGDLVDRGPDVPGVLRIVMAMVGAKTALSVIGNHEAKLARKLAGKSPTLSHGLARSVEQIAREPESFAREVRSFIEGLESHYRLDGGALVVAHAGLEEKLHGRRSGRVWELCMYGQATGEMDADGHPVRADWAADYRGDAVVVYGHTPRADAVWVNNTICVDTGCVFGGKLTALRWPERELVSVRAERVWFEVGEE